jgi:hypothetical protein
MAVGGGRNISWIDTTWLQEKFFGPIDRVNTRLGFFCSIQQQSHNRYFNCYPFSNINRIIISQSPTVPRLRSASGDASIVVTSHVTEKIHQTSSTSASSQNVNSRHYLDHIIPKSATKIPRISQLRNS